MDIYYQEYLSFQDIPARNALEDKKLIKYFNLETAALIAGIHHLFPEKNLAELPLFFCLCKIEMKEIDPQNIYESVKYFENLKLIGMELSKFENMDISDIPAIIAEYYSIDGKFVPELFYKKFFSNFSPVDQFKVLANLPVSFASIVFNLHGDNVTLYESGRSLVWYATTSGCQNSFLIGSAKASIKGSVKAGIALTSNDELQKSKYFSEDICAIEMFKNWSERGFH